MAEFTSLSLLDLTESIVDNRGRTCPTTTSGTPLIATNCLKSGLKYPAFENVRFVDHQTYSTWFRGHPLPGDILFVTKGSPGRVAVVPDPVSFCIAQDMVALRAKRSVVNGSYLYYRLLAKDVLDGIESLHVGTMIPHFKKGDFDKLNIRIHRNLSEQRAIAEILSALDDKITANGRAAIAAQDYLDTEANRLLSSSTSVLKFPECAQTVRGVSYRRADLQKSETALVTLKSISREGNFEFSGFKQYVGRFNPAQEVSTGDILVAQTDLTQAGEVIGRAVRVPAVDLHERLVASLDLAIVRPSGAMSTEYLLAALQHRDFRAHCASFASGTTVLHLARGAFESYDVPIVDPDSEFRYAERAAGIHRLIDALGQESRVLADTRDAILPLLMSGKLAVKDIERDIEDIV
ncbi:restriction endonuclease subunit S [Gordonia terrae]